MELTNVTFMSTSTDVAWEGKHRTNLIYNLEIFSLIAYDWIHIKFDGH